MSALAGTIAKPAASPLALAGGRNAVVTGDFWHGASERGLAQGMREAGWNVQEVPLLDHQLRSRALALRIAARLLDRFGARSYNAAIASAVDTATMDLLLLVKGSYVDPAVLAHCRRAGTTSALFYPDVYFDVAADKVERRLIADVDLLFTTKAFHLGYLDTLRGPGRTHLIHHGYSPLVHRPHHPLSDPAGYLYDIAYIGNPDATKLAWLTEIARRFPDRRMIVAGDRWAQLAQGTPLDGRTSQGRITGDLMAEIIQRSRVSLAIHASPDGPEGWRDGVSTRTFEIPACGGFMLHEDNPELRALFVPGAECGVFTSLDDLCEKVAYYLAHEDERVAIAERGHARCVPAYSYYERAREMLEVVTRHRG